MLRGPRPQEPQQAGTRRIRRKEKAGAAATAAETAAAKRQQIRHPRRLTEAESNEELKLSGPAQGWKSRTRTRQIEKLSKQRKTEEDLREEIENLQEHLVMIGHDHVDAKDRIKSLEGEKEALQERIAELREGARDIGLGCQGRHKAPGRIRVSRSRSLMILRPSRQHCRADLAAAQQLAQSRYKDLTRPP